MASAGTTQLRQKQQKSSPEQVLYTVQESCRSSTNTRRIGKATRRLTAMALSGLFLVVLVTFTPQSASAFVPLSPLSRPAHLETKTNHPFQTIPQNQRESRLVANLFWNTGKNNNNDDDDDENADESENPLTKLSKKELQALKPGVVPQRWVQLGYLSALALLSDWICFSVAATPETFESSFHHSAAGLIDSFLFMNVASCFLVTDVVAAVGLQTAIRGAAGLMALGCWFRSGFAFLGPVASTLGMSDALSHIIPASKSGLEPYPFVLVGTLMVGFAQPFFQCTPPLLSATWFAADERATSTAVALNFNQIGIATAFLVGGEMATTAPGMEQYFGLIAVLSTLVAAGAFLQFENKPPLPPSSSELEKLIKGEKEPPFIESIQTFFATPGFARPLAAFICSISITNIVGVSTF